MEIISELCCKHCKRPRSWHHTNTAQCFKPTIQDTVFEPVTVDCNEVGSRTTPKTFKLEVEFTVPQGYDLCWDGKERAPQAFHDLMLYTLSGIGSLCGSIKPGDDQMRDYYGIYYEMFKSLKITDVKDVE